MKRFLKLPRRLARRVRPAVEALAVAAFVVQAVLERVGDPGFAFIR